jgi:hypothetical protein
MTKEEVMQSIGRVADLKPRVVDSATPRVVMIGTEQLAIKPSSGSKSIPLSNAGSDSLMHLVGMSNKMRKDLSGGTFLKAASELLAAQGQFVVLTKDDIGHDFVGGKHYHAVDPERALRTMESLEITNYHRCYPLAEKRAVVIEAVGPRIESVVVGDRVQAGVQVSFSPFGVIAPAVSSFSLRLVCTNGAAIQEIEDTFKDTGGSRDANGFWDWFRKNVKTAYNEIGPMTERFKGMRDHRITPKDRAGAIEGIIRQGHLEELSEAIHARALQEPPHNAWDLLNLVTWAGTHASGGDYQLVRRANKAATTFSTNVSVHRVCPLCNSQN